MSFCPSPQQGQTSGRDWTVSHFKLPAQAFPTMGSVLCRLCQGLTSSLLSQSAACKLSVPPLARALGKAVHSGAGGGGCEF